MADLFKKLSVLIQAGLNDAIPEAINPATPQRRRLSPERLGKDIDKEVARLRERVNEAVEYEGRLTDQVRALEQEIAQWNRQADDAVTRGDEGSARYAIEQLKRAERRLEMVQSDLNAHQLVTQDLIQRVNLLDAVVADSRAEAEPAAHEKAAASAEASVKAVASVADVLRQAREKVGAPTESPAQAKPDDDLSERLRRLSKP
jgi:phage shock protein A